MQNLKYSTCYFLCFRISEFLKLLFISKFNWRKKILDFQYGFRILDITVYHAHALTEKFSMAVFVFSTLTLISITWAPTVFRDDDSSRSMNWRCLEQPCCSAGQLMNPLAWAEDVYVAHWSNFFLFWWVMMVYVILIPFWNIRRKDMTHLRKCDCQFKVPVWRKVSFLTANNDIISKWKLVFLWRIVGAWKDQKQNRMSRNRLNDFILCENEKHI